MTSNVYAEYFGDFLYTNLGSEIQITSWDGLSQSVEIPETIAGIPVKSIGDQAFSGKTIITSVTIPSSITNIGYQAFSSCGITNINVPNSVRSLGRYAFSGCVSLKSATISTNITEIPDGLFSSCSGLQNIEIPQKVTNIAYYSFTLCSSLTNASLGNSLQNISVQAFLNASKLKTINFPSSLKSIDVQAFAGCSSLTNINLPTGIQTIWSQAFRNCTSIETVTLPSSLSQVGIGVFYGCQKLRSATLSPCVFDLNWNNSGFFENCILLTSVYIPEGVTVIPNQMFRGCTQLEYLTLPSTITNVDNGAFQTCPNLKGLYFLGNAPTRASDLFTGGTTNVTIYYTQGASGWGSAFSGRPTALTGTFTLLTNYDSSKGILQLSPNQPYYNSGTVVTVYAIPNSGYIFSSWSGGPPESISSPTVISTNGIAATTTTITVNSNKTIGAIFNQDLSDSDGDTLSNFAELTIYGSNPNLADSNADGIADGKAVALGYSPGFNFSALMSYLQSYPPTGLYTASQMQAMAIGDLVLTKNANGSFNLNYDIEKSADLQSWIPYQSLTLSLTNLPPDKAFIRIKAKQ